VTSHTSLCHAVDCRCHSCVIQDGGQRCDWERTWSATEQDLNRVGRAVFVEVDLDAIADNCNILRTMCRNKNIGNYTQRLPSRMKLSLRTSCE